VLANPHKGADTGSDFYVYQKVEGSRERTGATLGVPAPPLEGRP
jgi:hypothetical protein